MPFAESSNELPYCLRFAYTTWLNRTVSITSIQLAIEQSKIDLQADNIKILEHRITNSQIQLLLSTRPTQSPANIAKFTKRRLSGAFKRQNYDKVLKREFSIRAVGENTTRDLQNYLRLQVRRRNFVDDRFAESLAPYSKEYTSNFEECERTSYGQYWYDLHLVISTMDRYSVAQENIWHMIIETSEAWHAENGHQLKSISLLPDHLHLLNRPDANTSPHQVGKGLIDRLNAIQMMQNIYHPTFYVAPHGVYAMNAIRNLQKAIGSSER